MWVENGETPQLTKKWEVNYLSQCFSLYQGCHSIPAAFCLQHRDERISLVIPENCEHYWIQWELEVTTDRSWQANHAEPWTQPTRWTRKIQRKAFLFGYSPSQLISRTWSTCARTLLWKRELRFGRRRFKSGHTKKEVVFTLTSAKNKKDPFCEQNRMVKWKRWSAKKWFSEQSPIRCRGPSSRHSMESVSNQNFRRRIYESSFCRRRSQKLFVRTIYYSLATIVKNYHGIIEQLHFIYQNQAELQKELYVEQQKRHQSHYCNLDRNDKRLDSVECFYYLRDDQDLLPDGKSPYERRFGESFLDMLCSRGEFWEEDILIAEIKELEKWNASDKYPRRLNA